MLKVELAWAINNLLQIISNKILLSITKSPFGITDTTKKQKNKAVLIKAYCMCGYVALSNVF